VSWRIGNASNHEMGMSACVSVHLLATVPITDANTGLGSSCSPSHEMEMGVQGSLVLRDRENLGFANTGAGAGSLLG
jgi:hypothetical protein